MTEPARIIKRPGAGVTIDRERLIRMRQLKLLSRAQLAQKMCDGDEFKITPDAIAKIENGMRRPKTATLARMCEVLGCEPEELLLPRSPEPDPEPRPVPKTVVMPRFGTVPELDRVPCPECGALYGHEPGYPCAT